MLVLSTNLKYATRGHGINTSDWQSG